jgi:hypothetical protein
MKGHEMLSRLVELRWCGFWFIHTCILRASRVGVCAAAHGGPWVAFQRSHIHAIWLSA